MTTPTTLQDPALLLAIWPVAQTTSQYQRAGRYLPGCTAHPGKMLPELARRIVTEYSSAGHVVVELLAGIGTTLVEAVRKARSRGLPRLVAAHEDLLIWRSR
jgi:DNA modification methylase